MLSIDNISTSFQITKMSSSKDAASVEDEVRKLEMVTEKIEIVKLVKQ